MPREFCQLQGILLGPGAALNVSLPTNIGMPRQLSPTVSVFDKRDTGRRHCSVYKDRQAFKQPLHPTPRTSLGTRPTVIFTSPIESEVLNSSDIFRVWLQKALGRASVELTAGALTAEPQRVSPPAVAGPLLNQSRLATFQATWIGVAGQRGKS